MATRDEIIADELQFDPLGRGYATTLSDDVAARDDMNSGYRTLEQGVWLHDLWRYLYDNVNNPRAGNPPSPRIDQCIRMIRELALEGTIQGQIETDPTNSGTPAPITTDHNYAAQAAWLSLEKAVDSDQRVILVDFGNPVHRNTYDKLLEVGIIDDVQRVEIEQLSNVPQSRAAEIGAPNVTTFEITKNRP